MVNVDNQIEKHISTTAKEEEGGHRVQPKD